MPQHASLTTLNFQLIAPPSITAAVISLLITLFVALPVNLFVLVLVAKSSGMTTVSMFVVTVLRGTKTVAGLPVIASIIQAVLIAVLAGASIIVSTTIRVSITVPLVAVIIVTVAPTAVPIPVPIPITVVISVPITVAVLLVLNRLILAVVPVAVSIVVPGLRKQRRRATCHQYGTSHQVSQGT